MRAVQSPMMRTAVCPYVRSEEHTSELQSHHDLVCRLLLEKKKHSDAVAHRDQGVRVRPSIMDGGLAAVSKVDADAVALQSRSLLGGVLGALSVYRGGAVAA